MAGFLDKSKINSAESTGFVQGGTSVNKTVQDVSVNIPVGAQIDINESIKNFAQSHNISEQIALQILSLDPAILTKTPEEQSQIISSFGQHQDVYEEIKDVREPEKPDGNNKLNYNDADISEKKLIILDELAKNLYVNRKDIDKQQALEEWQNSESLRSEKTQELTEKLKSYKNLQEVIYNTENNPKLTDKDKNSLLDKIMLSIQSANKKDISLLDYLKLDRFERDDILVEYLHESKSDLNSTENELLENTEKSKVKVLDFLEEQYGINLPKDVKFSEISKYMKELNLDGGKIQYDNLSSKEKNGTLSSEEEKRLNYLRKIYKTEAGQYIVDKARASKLDELEARFNELEAKVKSGTASEDERNHYFILQETLNSDETKRLKEIKDDLPIPKSDYDKKVVADLNKFKTEAVDSELVNDTYSEGTKLIQYIETQTKGMSRKDKQRFITTILKYNNDSSSIRVLSKYINEFPRLASSKYLMPENSLVYLDMDEPTKKVFLGTVVDNANNDDNNAKRAMTSISQVLENNGNKDGTHDNDITTYVNAAAQVNSSEVQDAALDASVLIKDVKAQGNAFETIQNGEFATDENQIHALNLAKQVAKENQIRVIDTATLRSSKATEYAAKNNIIAELHKDNQTSAFNIVHNRVQEQFEGEKAIELSCSLADQIQFCDKDNQLAMHNEIMTSKYSQVQEHAASNIRNYDVSVQQAALETVYKSGNAKAIEAGLNSISTSQSPEIIQSAVNNAICEFALNDETSDTHEKFLAGNLSVEDLREMPLAQRREYFETYFKKLPVEQKIKLLNSIPLNMKKTVYTMLARSNSIIFNVMCKSADTASNMLEMGLPVDVNSKIEGIVGFMASIDNSFRLVADKYKINYDTIDERPPVTAHTVPPSENLFSIYYRDNKGNLIG